MSDSHRPYEVDTTFSYAKKPWVWVVGLAIVAVVGGLIWWGVQKSKQSTLAYNYTTLVTTTDAAVGKSDSHHTMIIFEDYTCHVCSDTNVTYDAASEKYKDQLRVVYKPVDILSQGGDAIARAAYAAGKQNKFQQYSSAAFARRTEMGSKRETTMVEIAKNLGLDMDQWNEDRTFNTLIAQKTAWNQQDAKNSIWEGGVETRHPMTKEAMPVKNNEFGIMATPTVALMKDDKVISWWNGATTAEVLNQRIEEFLKK